MTLTQVTHSEHKVTKVTPKREATAAVQLAEHNENYNTTARLRLRSYDTT